MNIFYTDACPQQAAKNFPDIYTNKMCVESAQLLSAAIWAIRDRLPADALEMRLNKKGQLQEAVKGLYFNSHTNNPLTNWTGASQANYTWLLKHALYGTMEYSSRYGKVHTSLPTLQAAATYMQYITPGTLTPFYLALEDAVKPLANTLPPVECYRVLMGYKHLTRIKITSTGKRQELITWQKAAPPIWLPGAIEIARTIL